MGSFGGKRRAIDRTKTPIAFAANNEPPAGAHIDQFLVSAALARPENSTIEPEDLHSCIDAQYAYMIGLPEEETLLAWGPALIQTPEDKRERKGTVVVTSKSILAFWQPRKMGLIHTFQGNHSEVSASVNPDAYTIVCEWRIAEYANNNGKFMVGDAHVSLSASLGRDGHDNRRALTWLYTLRHFVESAGEQNHQRSSSSVEVSSKGHATLGTVSVDDDAPSTAEKMAVEHLPSNNPWRQIIEGPNFMAFPAKDLSDPSATFHDAYVIKLGHALDEGGWVPHKEVDALLRAQVLRMSVVLESDQGDGLITLGETTAEAISRGAQEVIDWAAATLEQEGPWAQMPDQDATHFYFDLLQRLKARCGLRSTDPALATADRKVLGPGLEMVIDHGDAQAAGLPQAQVFAAAYTTLLVGTAWGLSPFRERLVEIVAQYDETRSEGQN